MVRHVFGVSIVPKLANVQWSRDRALRFVPLPGVDVQRHVGLFERREHSRGRVTAAIKGYFAARECLRDVLRRRRRGRGRGWLDPPVVTRL